MRRMALLLALVVAALVVVSVGEGTAQEGSSDVDPDSSTIQPFVTVEAPAAAWGRNSSGQLGNGSNTDSNVPVQVSGLTGVTAISGGGSTSTGEGHSLALKDDGTVWAWGSNSSGQLGIGSNTDRNVPIKNNGLSGVITAVAAGSFHSLALRDDGTVWAWGSNSSGELGNGTSGPGTDSLVPVQVQDPTDPTHFLQHVTAISAGGSSSPGIGHSLALKDDGTVMAWGNNISGQLGNGTDGSGTESNVPVQVSNLSRVTAIAGGGTHSLAVKKVTVKRHHKRRTITVVMAWGANQSGQLGNGTFGGGTCDCINVPVQVSGLSGVTAVAGGGFHSLAVKNDGTVMAWGFNGSGQLGNGTNGSGTESNVPVRVSGLSGATAVDGGSLYSLAK